jgi:NAD(P)-dependent dehydrogenase (short-subunit alcohol dehydrogenase family)
VSSSNLGRLAGRVAIVTGAGAGNGEAIARAYAREGASVACADLNGGAATKTAVDIQESGGKAIAIQMDHCVAADCERTVATATESYGGLDILVNNAGIVVFGTVLDLSQEDWERQFRVNVLGPFLMTKMALPELIRRGGGAIVMISSASGLRPQPSGSAYVASKHAIVGLTKSLALDYAGSGIRVNAICPAVIHTRMAEQYWANRAELLGKTEADVIERVTRQYPLGRLGMTDDVAAIAVHLASDEARWTTGTSYLLDGGQMLVLGSAPEA